VQASWPHTARPGRILSWRAVSNAGADSLNVAVGVRHAVRHTEANESFDREKAIRYIQVQESSKAFVCESVSVLRLRRPGLRRFDGAGAAGNCAGSARPGRICGF